MAKLVELKKISLKNNPEINESMIQSFIFENPSVLGLGELTPIQREKIQPAGGRLDILLGDDNNRYEVEIQLGVTDPSHIIRTIEYWDSEKKRYPQYDHCAVIVAEEITGRFMNVISLFNGSIPLIALQVSAYVVGDEISLAFTKVIDRITIQNDEDEQAEVTDRDYWLKRSSKSMVELADKIHESVSNQIPGYSFKYNKFYIGLVKEGLAKNFISYRPMKKYMYLRIKGNEDQEVLDALDDVGLEATYENRWKRYSIKIASFDEFDKNQEYLMKLIQSAKEYLMGE